MISLTNHDGNQLLINSSTISRVIDNSQNSYRGTTSHIVFTDGEQVSVRESIGEIGKRIAADTKGNQA